MPQAYLNHMTTDPQNPQYNPHELHQQFHTWHNKQTLGQSKNTFTLTELYYWLGCSLRDTQTLIQIWQEINIITQNTKYPSSGLGDEQYQFKHNPQPDTNPT